MKTIKAVGGGGRGRHLKTWSHTQHRKTRGDVLRRQALAVHEGGQAPTEQSQLIAHHRLGRQGNFEKRPQLLGQAIVIHGDAIVQQQLRRARHEGWGHIECDLKCGGCRQQVTRVVHCKSADAVQPRGQHHALGRENTAPIGGDDRVGVDAFQRVQQAVVVQVIEQPHGAVGGHSARDVDGVGLGDAVIRPLGVVAGGADPQRVFKGAHSAQRVGIDVEYQRGGKSAFVTRRIHGSGREGVQAIGQSRAAVSPAPAGCSTHHGCAAHERAALVNVDAHSLVGRHRAGQGEACVA